MTITKNYVAPQTPLPNQAPYMANGDVVLQRTYRDVPAAKARIIENVWVAAGVAGAIAGGWMLVDLFLSWRETSEAARAATLISGVFLVVLGVYAVLRFGLDEWYDLAFVLALQGENADLLRKIDDLEADAETLRSEAQQARRVADSLRMKVELRQPVEPTQRQPAESREILAVRRILDKWMHDVPFTRDVLTARDGNTQTMTEAEWNRAMQLLEQAGYIGKGGSGNRQRVIVPPVADKADARRMMIEAVQKLV